ncbi:MAG TPA: tRNA (adenosine(37)-N6)-threonylcarbamoyltransferase complex dimerization subunit type 1 TsaB [Pirellulales bacterium]|nr:tRNA (adenosine(37)-N6)-threonylcarbamoyltransferase complex dimerization subunit type 1 TsaB [Pirellulales bacterium]
MEKTRILALETSGMSGSVAALAGDALLSELPLHPDQRSARSLAPGIRDLLLQVGWRASDVELLAVTVGPGSFTGLRVGVTTAKTFAYAVGAKVIGLNTLEVIAAQVPGDLPGETLAVALDAQRGEVFAAMFRRGARDTMEWLIEAAIVNRGDWLASLPVGCLVSGPVLSQLAGDVPAGRVCVTRELWHPTAAAVGRLAAARFAAGQLDDPWRLVPLYMRRSAAEEKAG